jgi:alkane 1-monooxygenase
MHTVSGFAPRSISSLRTCALHLWAFALPLTTLTFWLTGPHAWWALMLWTLPLFVLVYTDNRAPSDRRQPPEALAAWPFDLQVYLLFGLQVLNYVLLGVVTSQLSVSTWPGVLQAVAMIFPVTLLAGVTAGASGIVLAHELVHRRNPIEYMMGRVLLMGVLYEHFATEHVRGHHPRVGTLEDPATARFGETHREFVRRTIPAQFKSAWRLEKVRLGDPSLPWYSVRMLRHRVLQGVVAQLLILAAYVYVFGWLATVYFVLQARIAVLLLESVNYVEHWGLARSGKKVISVDSWDTENWFTLYTLIGLSRHADHHAQAARPYQKLRHFEETAKMPSGYYGTVVLALFRNERYRELATAELRHKRLGPFRESEAEAPRTHVHPSLRAASS